MFLDIDNQCQDLPVRETKNVSFAFFFSGSKYLGKLTEWKTTVGQTFNNRARRDFSKTLQKVAIENRVQNMNGKFEGFHVFGNFIQQTLVIKLWYFISYYTEHTHTTHPNMTVNFTPKKYIYMTVKYISTDRFTAHVLQSYSSILLIVFGTD